LVATYDGAMTRVRRLTAIALCAGLAVGVAGQLTGQLDLSRVGSLSQTFDKAPDRVADKGTDEALDRDSGRDGTDQPASSVPDVYEQAARLEAAHKLLSARAVAVKARNKSAWMSAVDVGDSAFRQRQSVAFDNLVKLPLGQLSFGAERPAPALTPARLRQVGPGAWATTVTVSYSLAGFDRAPQSFEATYTLVKRPGGWRLADDVDGITPMQMWDLPGLRVLRGRTGMVVGNAPEARMRDYRALADSAVRRVSGVWGTHWSSHVVIVTPSTKGEFARLLSRPADRGLDQVAAITQGVIEPGRRAQGDRVVINPNAFTALQASGRRVVITHELTHVAARSLTTSPVPIWLTEGMADYVGYSGLDLPPERVASQLLTLVRAGRGPTRLPIEVDFDPSRSKIGPSYAAAWLAVSRLVNLYGQARVVAFYRGVASSATTGSMVRLDPAERVALAFPTSFGVTEARFVGGWKRYLRTLAHAPP
jgi:hypothetical protein